MSDMKFEKHTGTEKIGEYELRKFHIIKPDFDKTEFLSDLDFFCDTLYDDYEDAYSNGLSFFYDDLYSMNVKKFICYIDDQISTSDDSDEISILALKGIRDKIKEYVGYTLYF